MFSKRRNNPQKCATQTKCSIITHTESYILAYENTIIYHFRHETERQT